MNRIAKLSRREREELFLAQDAPEFEMYYRAGDDKYIAEVRIPVVKNNLKGMDK